MTPTSHSGHQLLKGVIYADHKRKPASLLGTSTELNFASTSAAGWYHLSFPSPLQLAAGRYWIGVITGARTEVAGERSDSVRGAENFNANTYTSGPTNPFGSVRTSNEQMSLYATFTAR